MQPEARVSRVIIQYLNSLPEGWAFKVHGSEYQTAGVPDILACYRGLFLGIETKMPGNKPSTIQDYIMGKIRKAEGLVLVAYSLKDVQEWVQHIDAQYFDSKG